MNLENVMVTPGARFGVFLAISTLLDPNDEIIVIEPAWPAYRQCAINSGIKVRSIKTTLENKWEPDLKEISSCINENTKMIVLNYPNNPTGKILPRTLQDQIVEIAKKISCIFLVMKFTVIIQMKNGIVFYHMIMKNQLLHSHFQNHIP